MSDQDKPHSFKGKKNIYVCPDCYDHIVTVDRDHGVTPFMIKCQRTKICGGMMESSIYRVFDQRMNAEFEWYTPGPEDLIKQTPSVRYHVDRGGLLMRKIEP